MNILLLSRYFPPEIGTAANLFFELARGLSARGHRVTVVTGFPWYNLEEIPERYKKRAFMKEEMDGVTVVRIRIPVAGPKKFRLAAGHLTAPVASVLGGIINRKPDVIYIYSPPLFMTLSGWVLELLKRTPFVMGVQDIHPQGYIDQGVLKNRFLIYILEEIEKFCYKKSTLITVHSEGNKRHLIDIKGVPEYKVKIIYNWIDTDEMRPLPRENEFSKRYDLNSKFIVGYAGALSISQGLMSIVEAANILRDRKDIEFFIVGDGIEKDRMIRKANELNLTNIRFLGMQPKSLYPLVVASSDIQLVTLNKNVKTPVVPSKIISIMAGGRPVLASLPLDGDAARLIKEANCGICVAPEDPRALAEAILRLAGDEDLRRSFAENGRRYAERELSLKSAVERLEGIFEEAIDHYSKRKDKN